MTHWPQDPTYEGAERRDHRRMEEMLELAAERGAKKALASIGLHDESAGQDVRDLRDMLGLWRDIRRAVATTIAKAIVVALLSMLAAGAYFYFGRR